MAVAKKKAVPVKDMALARQDLGLLKDVISIADLATAFGTEATVEENNLDKAVEVLARVREAERKLKALYDLSVADLKAEIKKHDDERKVLMKRLESADVSVAEGIIELYRNVGEVAFTRRQQGALGSSATVVPNGYKIEVTDADSVPDDFILPPASRASRVNTSAIEEVFKAGGTVAGVKATKKFYLTTRASETIKKVKHETA